MIQKLCVVLFFCASTLHAQNTAGNDSWKALRFLIGTWEAKTSGGQVQSIGTYTFRPELRNHVLVRHSSSEGCKGPEDYDCQHGDVLYIYPEASGQSYKAIYFDNEGHVIHYNVTVPTATSALFLSYESQPGPQFRLTYELKDGVMLGKFQIKMPGEADFRSYLEWSGARRE